MIRRSSQPQGKAWRQKSRAGGGAVGTSRLCGFQVLIRRNIHFTDLYKLSLVKLSMEQKDALTVLLTGRGEANFAELIKRMVRSQKLDFDLMGLKPEVGPSGQRFPSTMNFKQRFLEDLILTYEQAEEVRVYEDRVRQ